MSSGRSGKRQKMTKGSGSVATANIPPVTLRTVDKNNNLTSMKMPCLGLGTYKFKKDSGRFTFA